MLSKLQALVHIVFSFSRVDLDSGGALRVQPFRKDHLILADEFMSAVVVACLHQDCIIFARIIDVRNLHR